jgi:hypothetical protein
MNALGARVSWGAIPQPLPSQSHVDLLTGLRLDPGRDILLRDETRACPPSTTGNYGKGALTFYLETCTGGIA